MNKLRSKLAPVTGATEHYGHLVYFGLVALEGHGLYAYAAAVLLVVGMAMAAMRIGGEE